MTITEHQHEQDERLETMLQDAELRKRQENTMLGFALEETIPRGRYTAPGGVGTPQVTGSRDTPQYPAAGGPWQGPDPVGIEPPLGHEINSVEPFDSSPLENGSAATGGPAEAPTDSIHSPGSAVEQAAGPSPSSAIGDESTLEESIPASGSTAKVGSSPTNKPRSNDDA
jgi:hypothetical protein